MKTLLANLDEAAAEPKEKPKIDCSYTAPQKPEYKGEFFSLQTKLLAAQGEEFDAIFYIKNTGNTTWFSDESGCTGNPLVRLGTAKTRDRVSYFYNPADARWKNATRIVMKEGRVNPGEVATFAFTGKAPRVSDIFREYFQPVVEGVAWMDDKEETPRLDVYVGDYSKEDEQKLTYMGVSSQASAIDLSGQPGIHVDISSQTMQVRFGNTVVRDYKVSTGSFNTPTPTGRFKILNKSELRIGSKSPHYRMPSWQAFSQWGHGFHALPYLANDKGTFWSEALTHIGRPVSHGCVRLLDDDATDLFGITQVGWEVVIHA